MEYVLSVLAGSLVVLSMTINSGLGVRIGVFRATAVNYSVGLGGAVLLGFAVGYHPQTWTEVPWWAWSGGLLGVGIVAASNLTLPRVPVVLATVLIVLGQLSMGLVLDALREGHIPWSHGLGAALVLVGALVSQLSPPQGDARSPGSGSEAIR